MSTELSSELKAFRQTREANLKKDWLTVVGLVWLNEGENLMGSAAGQKIQLPKTAPAKLGKIYVKSGQVELELVDAKGVLIDGKLGVTGKRYPLTSDKNSQPTLVTLNTVSFFVIDRLSGLGLRVRDTQSETLQNFKGLSWWDETAEFRVNGSWKPIDPPMKLMIPDVTGHSQEEHIAGSVNFTLKGQQFELFPTRTGDKLFFVFKDETSGKSSYGTGRFLTAEVDSNGHVIMDFNKAYNPPCAYIHFATCPIAPSINRLTVAIEAGEKTPPGHSGH